MKKKILIITPFFEPNIGGVETHLNDLCNYLSSHDFRVFVLTYQPLTTKIKARQFEKKKNLYIHRINWPSFNLFYKLESHNILEFLYVTPPLLVYSFLFLLFNNKDVDTIHAQGLNAALISGILSFIFKKRSVISTHAIYELKRNSLFSKALKIVLSSADVILALSKPSQKELIDIGLPSKKVKLYHYWIDLKNFKPFNRKVIKSNFKNNFIVLFVGRLIKIKGVNVLLKVAKQTPQIFYLFIGDGPLASNIKKISKNYENVKFLGKKTSKELPFYYNEADISCFPSQHSEGFGRVILESLACGTPVIASNLGGIPEAMNSSVGFLIKPTAKNLKKTIEYIHSNPNKLKKMEKKCRTYINKNFSSKNAKLITMYY